MISIQSTHTDPKGFHSSHSAPGLDSLLKKYPYATESTIAREHGGSAVTLKYLEIYIPQEAVTTREGPVIEEEYKHSFFWPLMGKLLGVT